MKKKLLILCKDLYFNLPCIKYSRACGWSYYDKILGICIDPRGQEKNSQMDKTMGMEPECESS